MNIEFESKDGNIHQLEVTLTSYTYDEDTNYEHGVTIISEDYIIKIESIPEGLTWKEIEHFAVDNHMDELIDEYQDGVDWKKQGMEFFHNN